MSHLGPEKGKLFFISYLILSRVDFDAHGASLVGHKRAPPAETMHFRTERSGCGGPWSPRASYLNSCGLYGAIATRTRPTVTVHISERVEPNMQLLGVSTLLEDGVNFEVAIT